MLDTNGMARTDPDLDPEFSSIITVADPMTKKGPKKKAPPPYPAHAQWVISFQDNFQYVAVSNDYYQAILSFGDIANEFGGAVTYFPGTLTNAQTFPLRYPWTNPVVNVSVPTMIRDVHALESLLSLTNSRNFYYNGHGDPRGIASFLSAEQIQYNDLRGRYYRFVFLDACATAQGALPAAFGINVHDDLPLSYFQKRGIRPRVFLGYDTDVHYMQNGTFVENGVTYHRRVLPEVVDFLTNFEFYWYFYYHGVDDALYNAYINTPSSPPGDWETGGGHLKVFGYAGMGIDDYNGRSDWPQ
jgi:hypothetical protein